ncbi:MAG TPA: carbohydrate kinase [Tepidisphaeraceae bacterium]|nr:carbohydrate kinase [Tepidisphaeraceae bacterium]
MAADKIPVLIGIGEILWDMLPGGKQLGGAPANFAYHANALGGRGLPVSRIGDDELGREILARLERFGLDRGLVAVDPHHPTGTVDVHLDTHGVPQYVIHEKVAWDFLENSPQTFDLAARANVVCFGSLAQRSAGSRAAITEFVGAVPRGCLRIFDINLRQTYFSREVIDASLRMSDVLKLNDGELPTLVELLNLPVTESDALAELMSRYSLRLIALTRGGAGSTLIASDGAVSTHYGFPVEVADTVGAGDAFTAALALGLLAGWSLHQINDHANQVASYVCSQAGAMPAMPPNLAVLPRG